MDEKERIISPEPQNEMSLADTLPPKRRLPPWLERVILWADEKKEGELPLVLAFFLPFLIFSVCLALQGVYPFGNGQIINYDGWHQYYPFLLQLWDHFHEGTSLAYDWSMGMGTNFLSMLSYYGSSPLNLLLLLVPVREFRLLFTLFTAIRIGFAGLFCALFLKKVFSSPGWSVAFFGLGYALCGYMMGYYWNNMWLDTVALYPLLCLATVKLFREGKCSLYVFTLALSLFSNYYIGFMCCVFTVIVFFSLCVLDKVRFSDFIRRGFRLLITTLLGAGISAALLLPAFFGLLNTASTQESTPMYVSFYESVRDLIAPLSSFHDPVVMDGLPNLATAAILILFAFSFLWAKKIGLREKLVAFFVVIFLVFSMNFSVLNYIWHGFHYTNMIPYRFAFLFAFVIVLMAYRYYRKAADGFDLIDAVGMILFSAVIAFCAYGLYPDASILATVAVFALTLVITALLSGKMLSKRIFSAVVCLILTVEMCAGAFFGTRAVDVSDYEAYFDLETGEEIFSLVEQVKELEEGGSGFYRMESTEWRSLNDSCFYGYPGISQFSSAANLNVARFLQGLGMPADPGSNRFVYVHGTPLSNTLLGVKYLISKTGYLSDTDLKCISPASNDCNSALYECMGFSGLGFMIDSEGADFQFDLSQKPYERQNELFRAITGLEGDLFTPIYAKEGVYSGVEVESLGEDRYAYTVPESEDEGDPPVMRFVYEMPQRAMVYVYANVPGENYVQVNNAWHCIEDYPNLFSAGLFAEKEALQLRVVLQQESAEEYSSDCSFDVVMMDSALWEKGLEALQDEILCLTAFEDTRLEGTVTAKKDGFLYTSIPWEMKESWTVLVDGKQVETYAFAGSFVGIPLTEGEHRIECTYSPLGLKKGSVISLISLLLFVALWYAEKKGFCLFRDKPLPPAPIQEELPLTEENAEKGEADDHSEIDEHYPQGS